MAVLTAPARISEADHDHEAVEQQLRPQRADDVHRQAADEVVGVVLHAHVGGDEQHGQEADAAGQHQAVEEDDEGGLLEVLQLRRLDFAVNLGQRLLAAHGQDRVAEGDEDAEQADQAQPVGRGFAADVAQRLRRPRVLQEPRRVFHLLGGRVELGVEVRRRADGVGRAVLGVGGAMHGQRHAAPRQHHHAHDGGDDHDFQRFFAGFVDADDVLAEEVEGGEGGDEDRAEPLGEVARVGVDGHAEPARHDFEDQADDVLPAGDGADRPGQDVVEHEGGHGELGHELAQRFADDAVDAAADEQGAALDVDRADGVAEEHDAEDEPRGGRADGLLDDAADVVGRAGQVAEDDGGGAPVADEGEHHAADDDDLSWPQQTAREGSGRVGRLGSAVRRTAGGRSRHEDGSRRAVGTNEGSSSGPPGQVCPFK